MREEIEKSAGTAGERRRAKRRRRRKLGRQINGMKWKHIVVQVGGGSWMQLDGELFGHG